MQAPGVHEADEAEAPNQVTESIKSPGVCRDESSWQVKHEDDQHYAFINGRSSWRPVPLNGDLTVRLEEAREREWISSSVVASSTYSTIAGRRGASGRTSTPHAGDKGELDLFSDADRENFETRDYTTTTFTLGFGGKGKRAEGNNTSSRDTFVFTGISAESTVAAPNSSVHPPRKLPSKAQRQKMAGRGRGRGGFNPGQLKGATWEYDAGAILETKPSELFPVSIPSCLYALDLTLPASPKPQEASSPHRKGAPRNQQLPQPTSQNPPWSTLHTIYQAQCRCSHQGVQRGTIQCAIWRKRKGGHGSVYWC